MVTKEPPIFVSTRSKYIQSEKNKQNIDIKTKFSKGYEENALKFSLINNLIEKIQNEKIFRKEQTSLLEISLLDFDITRDHLDHEESYVTQ